MRSKEDIFKAMDKCRRDLLSLGIEPGRITERRVVNLEGDDYGMTYREETPDGGYTYRIGISDLYLDERVSDKELRGIIYHELLHTVDGCMEHGGKWTDLATRVEEAYPGCPVIHLYDRYGQIYNPGVPAEVVYELHHKGKERYIVRCRRCGRIFYHNRRSGAVTHPEKYRHGSRCGGGFDVYDIKENPKLPYRFFEENRKRLNVIPPEELHGRRK